MLPGETGSPAAKLAPLTTAPLTTAGAVAAFGREGYATFTLLPFVNTLPTVAAFVMVRAVVVPSGNVNIMLVRPMFMLPVNGVPFTVWNPIELCDEYGLHFATRCGSTDGHPLRRCLFHRVNRCWFPRNRVRAANLFRRTHRQRQCLPSRILLDATYIGQNTNFAWGLSMAEDGSVLLVWHSGGNNAKSQIRFVAPDRVHRLVCPRAF